MRRWIHIAPFIVLIAAFALLHAELRHLDWEDFLTTLKSYSPGKLVLALAVLGINFIVWSLYDYSSLRQLGEKIPYGEILKTCSIAFPFTNLIGYSMITGFAVRANKYSRHGLSMGKIAQLIFFNVEAWWVGFLAVAGVSLLVVPESGKLFHISPAMIMWIGASLIFLTVIYLGACGLANGRTVRLGRFPIDLPDFKGGLLKFCAGAADGVAIALTFYILLPDGNSLSLIQFMAFYFVGQLIATASFVPGGLGVLEGSLLFLLRPYMSDAKILSSLVLFRAVHYLIPVVFAGLLLLYIAARTRSETGQARISTRALVTET
jgi:uncharacterized membrane protein YbhN (UPF0104 family)